MLEALSPTEAGYRIRRVRTLAGLTGQQLGEGIGFDPKNAGADISQLENGRRGSPRTDVLMAIARYAVQHGDLREVDDDRVAQFLLGLVDSFEVTIRHFRAAPSAPGAEQQPSQKSGEGRRSGAELEVIEGRTPRELPRRDADADVTMPEERMFRSVDVAEEDPTTVHRRDSGLLRKTSSDLLLRDAA